MEQVPKLRKEKKVINIHDNELVDDYAWKRDLCFGSMRNKRSH